VLPKFSRLEIDGSPREYVRDVVKNVNQCKVVLGKMFIKVSDVVP
jgi:hypothetical protein